MSARPPDRPIYVIRLQALPNVDSVKALRHALKFLLRVCKLRCLSIEKMTGAQQ